MKQQMAVSFDVFLTYFIFSFRHFTSFLDLSLHLSVGLVNYYILILLAIFVGGSVAALVRSWAFTLAGTRVVCRIRRNLFKAIIKQEIAFFDETRTGELTNRLSSDTQVVQNAVTVSENGRS